MKKKSIKKLVLSKTTVNNLDDIRGGAGTFTCPTDTCWTNCATCWTCPPMNCNSVLTWCDERC